MRAKQGMGANETEEWAKCWNIGAGVARVQRGFVISFIKARSGTG